MKHDYLSNHFLMQFSIYKHIWYGKIDTHSFCLSILNFTIFLQRKIIKILEETNNIMH